MTTTSMHCDFCNELSGGKENSFNEIYGAIPQTRILSRSNQFAVFPSLGQIVQGYLLLLPIKHFSALGDLSGPLLDELADKCTTVGKILQDEYGPCIFFEHGTRSVGVGGCGIYHAHLHAVPLAGMSDPVNTLKSKFSYRELAHPNEINARSAGLATYLFYQDTVAKLYLFDTGPLPSQYMRKVLADSLGVGNWNWRTAGREDRLLATIDRLSGRFETEGKAIHEPQPTNAIQQSHPD